MTALTQSYYCGASDAQIIYRTIGDYLDEISERFPNNEALVVRHQNVDWNYREFPTGAQQLRVGAGAVCHVLGVFIAVWVCSREIAFDFKRGTLL